MLDYEVIIPVRNGGSMLLEAIESVKKQSLPPRRLIVVDDGSTDGTAARARVAAPDATVITQENRGLGGALDTGVAACNSAFIAFLDHDDLWTPDKSASQMERILKPDCPDVVSGAVINRWVRGNQTIREELMGPARMLGASLFRAEFVRALGTFSLGGGHHEIVSWWASAALRKPTVVLDEEVALIRRIHGANSTMGATKEHADRDLFRRLREHARAKRE